MARYTPSKTILKRYAKVLVNYALNSGKGVKKGEVVYCVVPDVAKPLALELQNTILKTGAHPLMRLLPTKFDKDFYRLASHDQLTFFPREYLKARVDLLDHQIGIIADVDPRELEAINPKKIIIARDSEKPYKDWLTDKEVAGKFTWTVALWGTQAKAKIVGLSLQEYWQQIIRACFLDQVNPIEHWRRVAKLQQKWLKKLNNLPIQLIKVTGKNVDLTLTLGSRRIWVGGSGCNIPSFEIFTSPDWRMTEGWISFNQPVYRYGNIMKGIFLQFKAGRVSKASAKQGNRLLQAMLKSPNADKIGEFSLTDKRLSRIDHFMAETLFDENISGAFGNCHLALGMAYKDCFSGAAAKLSKKDWNNLGFNDSAEHTDMIITTDRTVTAVLKGGTEKIIYQNGQFTL